MLAIVGFELIMNDAVKVKPMEDWQSGNALASKAMVRA